MTQEQEQNSLPEEEITKAAPARRGRKKSESAEAALENATETAPKTRGRKKKVEEPAGEAEAPKPARRTRKKDVSEEGTGEEGAVEIAAQKAEAAPAQLSLTPENPEAPAEAPKPARRGRKPKAETEAEAAASETAPEKPKRGRKKKIDEAAESAAVEASPEAVPTPESAEAQEGPESAPAEKPRPARRTVRKKKEEAPVEAPAQEAAPAQPLEAPEAAAAPLVTSVTSAPQEISHDSSQDLSQDEGEDGESSEAVRQEMTRSQRRRSRRKRNKARAEAGQDAAPAAEREAAPLAPGNGPEPFADVSQRKPLEILQPAPAPWSEDDVWEDEPQTAFPLPPPPPSADFPQPEVFEEGEDVNGNTWHEPRQARPERQDRQKRFKNDRNERNDRNGRSKNRRGQERPDRPERPAAPGRNLPAIPESSALVPVEKAPEQPRQDVKKPQTRQAPAPVAAQSSPQLVEEAAPLPGKRSMYMSVHKDEQVEVVITENGIVSEYFVEMTHQRKVRGNIYKGVINNIDANLQAAFVNYGGNKNGFLQIDEVHPEYWNAPHDATKGHKYPQIQKALRVGQEVLVQVVKEPAGTKGAFLTTWISLAGRYLVLTPGQEQIGVSRKVEDPEERARLKELLTGIEPGPGLGVILRTASAGAGKTNIQKDLQYLKRLWKDVLRRVSSEKTPSLIYQEADLARRAVRDYMSEDINEIWVDDAETVETISEMASLLYPRRAGMVKLHQDPRQTLWERFNLQGQLESVTSREVILPSGGRLVFDQTEALMAIDINSGKTQMKSANFEAMVHLTNKEAAEAIARHLRLRDIGGQVVIDFIEMRDKNHCRDVEKALRNAMKADRARHDIGHMSSFGLLELVRQRIGSSAISLSSEPCPHCRGTGVRRNMEWQALQSLREIENKSRETQAGQTFTYQADPELALYLLNAKRDRLLDLESRKGIKIEVRMK